MGLRVTFVTLMLGVSLAFEAAGTRVETFYALIILTYALTIPSALLLRALKTPSALSAFFWTQVGIDFLLETVLVARTGGHVRVYWAHSTRNGCLVEPTPQVTPAGGRFVETCGAAQWAIDGTCVSSLCNRALGEFAVSERDGFFPLRQTCLCHHIFECS